VTKAAKSVVVLALVIAFMLAANAHAGVTLAAARIGAGVRTNPSSFMLFEKRINVSHEFAPQAKRCFNQLPSAIAEAVQRWL
jgi:hypothetical protein